MTYILHFLYQVMHLFFSKRINYQQHCMQSSVFAQVDERARSDPFRSASRPPSKSQEASGGSRLFCRGRQITGAIGRNSAIRTLSTPVLAIRAARQLWGPDPAGGDGQPTPGRSIEPCPPRCSRRLRDWRGEQRRRSFVTSLLSSPNSPSWHLKQVRVVERRRNSYCRWAEQLPHRSDLCSRDHALILVKFVSVSKLWRQNREWKWMKNSRY